MPNAKSIQEYDSAFPVSDTIFNIIVVKKQRNRQIVRSDYIQTHATAPPSGVGCVFVNSLTHICICAGLVFSQIC